MCAEILLYSYLKSYNRHIQHVLGYMLHGALFCCIRLPEDYYIYWIVANKHVILLHIWL